MKLKVKTNDWMRKKVKKFLAKKANFANNRSSMGGLGADNLDAFLRWFGIRRKSLLFLPIVTLLIYYCNTWKPWRPNDANDNFVPFIMMLLMVALMMSSFSCVCLNIILLIQ